MITYFIIFIISLIKANKLSWTYQDLSDYTKKHHLNEPYYISDPEDILTRNQKAVLKLRMQDIYESLNISTQTYIISNINTDNINIDSNISDEEEFEYQSNNITDYKTKIINDNKINIYIKNLVLNTAYSVNKSYIMTLFISVKDPEIRLKFEKDILPMLSPNETNSLLEYKKERILKKDYFTAIDHIYQNFLYAHKPKTWSQTFQDYLNIFSEIFVVIAMIYSYMYLSGPTHAVGGAEEEAQSQSQSTNKNKKQKRD